MKWLTSLFAPKTQDQSANVAKERLQVIFAHERARATICPLEIVYVSPI